MAGPLLVKLGGSLLDDAGSRRDALASLAGLRAAREDLVIVHGGGKHIDRLGAAMGIPRRVHAGLRITDGPTRDVVVAALAGIVNKTLVSELQALGCQAAGLSGADGGMLLAARHEPVGGVDLGHVGRIVTVDLSLLSAIMASGALPVVAALAAGPDHELLNVNADAAAAAMAAALGSRRLVFLTDVDGVRGPDGLPFREILVGRVASMVAEGVVTGGMRPKLLAATAAIRAGVPQVVIVGPRERTAVMSGAEGGTRLVA